MSENSFSKDPSSLLDRLSKIVSKPGLEMSDLVGTRTVINIAVSNSNNMSAFNERYERLSQVYGVLTSRLDEMTRETNKCMLILRAQKIKKLQSFVRR
ncbi:MAG: hypothetical protein CM15mP62_34220 [Rhodospirillaceae bacterium]|nr:MAG: hypothetical protein CM15mP62_34220 [Rhodospirillaceae bacterium]